MGVSLSEKKSATPPYPYKAGSAGAGEWCTACTGTGTGVGVGVGAAAAAAGGTSAAAIGNWTVENAPILAFLTCTCTRAFFVAGDVTSVRNDRDFHNGWNEGNPRRHP